MFVSRRTTASLRLPIIFLLFLSAYFWTPYHLLFHVVPETHNKKGQWPAFFDVFYNARPDASTIFIDGKEVPSLPIQNVTARTPRFESIYLSDNCLKASQVAHASFIEAIPNFANLLDYREHTRGIVSVGGGHYMSVLLVSIRMLRKTGSTLPVEVYVPKADDFDFRICDVLKDLKAQCVVLPKFGNFTISRFQYKAIALLASEFEDILFLDADNFPIVDPSEFFDEEPYTSTGLVTWPDFWASTTSSIFYQLTSRITPPLYQSTTTESGQILLSKRKHTMTLLLATYYNIYGPTLFYKLLSQNGPGEGDKETFSSAAMTLQTPFYQVRERVRELGYNDTLHVFHGLAMLQHHPGDDYKLTTALCKSTTDLYELPHRHTHGARIVFVHQQMLKLNPGTLLTNFGGMEGQRMWGPRQSTVERFGPDLEESVWIELIQVACMWGVMFPEWASEGDGEGSVYEALKQYFEKLKIRDELEADNVIEESL
jgi:alpha 1,2-mannosyltransferase